MALDDEYLDPEPVCIYGIDKEVAVDKLRDAGLMGRGGYLFYRILWRNIGYFAAAEAGYFISSGDALDVALGVAALIAAAIGDYGLDKENRDTAELFRREAERQAKALKGLNN